MTTTNDMLTVELASVEQANYLMDTLAEFCTPGMQTGCVVTISPEGLTLLAALDDHADGHFDGIHVWIGGSEYVALP